MLHALDIKQSAQAPCRQAAQADPQQGIDKAAAPGLHRPDADSSEANPTTEACKRYLEDFFASRP